MNCKLKSVREAVKNYSENVIGWTAKIHRLVISEDYAKSKLTELGIAGYTTPVMQITENDLVKTAALLNRSLVRISKR